jgi:hypothetical protein
MGITTAGRAHNCRHDDGHRITKGMRRLTVKSDGDEHHYCLNCAAGFLTRDLGRLGAMLEEVRSLTP